MKGQASSMGRESGGEEEAYFEIISFPDLKYKSKHEKRKSLLKLFDFRRIKFFGAPKFCLSVSSKTVCLSLSLDVPTWQWPGHRSTGQVTRKPGTPKQPPSPVTCAPLTSQLMESSYWILTGTEKNKSKRTGMGRRWHLEGKSKHWDRTTSFATQNFTFSNVWFSVFNSVHVCRVGVGGNNGGALFFSSLGGNEAAEKGSPDFSF